MPRIRRFPAGLRLSMCEESRATSAAGCAAAGLLLGFVSLRARLVGGIVGVVTITPDQQRSTEEVLRAADQTMYRVKLARRGTHDALAHASSGPTTEG